MMAQINPHRSAQPIGRPVRAAAVRASAWLAAAMLLGAVLLCSGCEVFGFAAHVVAGDAPGIRVEAEYDGLVNQRVAVLVDADLATLYRHPLARYEVASAVSRDLAAEVEGITVLDARQVVDYQNRNIYWNTLTYKELAEALKVTRLVLVDLIDYRLHEPGNIHLWRGLITANVGVAEADGPTPDDLAYATVVSVAYPPDRPMGVVNSDQQTIRLATLDLFARAVGGKFHAYVKDRE